MAIAFDILLQELPPDTSSRHHAVVAVVATPLGEVVCNVKGRRGWYGIFIVNEMDALRFALCSGRAIRWRECYHVGTEKVAVGKNQLRRDG